MQTPAEYKAFFETIVSDSQAWAGLELNSFFYGDSPRIIGAQRSDIEYPALWLELPEMTLTNSADNFITRLSGGFVILSNFQTDDWEGQDNFLHTAYQIARRIIKQMYDAEILPKGTSFDCEPIQNHLSDNMYGYRITFSITNIEADFLC